MNTPVFKHPFVVVGAAGLCAGFAFAPLPLGPLALVAFVPLLLAIEHQLESKSYNTLLYTFFFCFHGAANWWVMSWQRETDPYLMLAGAGLWLGHPFFLMPAFWLYKAVRRRTDINTALGFLVVAWTAFEWLHSLGDLSYPWLALGYTQLSVPSIAQAADIGGVWLVSLFVMAVNAMTTSLILHPQRRRTGIIRITALILVMMVYGQFRLVMHEPHEKRPAFRAMLVQPSINPWRKWEGGLTDMIRTHLYLQDSVNAIETCQLSVWSETALPFGLHRPGFEQIRDMLTTSVNASGTSLLTGYVDYSQEPYMGGQQSGPPRIYNSAGMLNPFHADMPTHHKSRLTPFGEYMPFSEAIPAIQTWLRWGVGISGWNKGDGATSLPVVQGGDTIAVVGPVICIESIYPDHVADYVRNGADVLAVITNDAWYDGTFGPRQHYAISQMRAIETRREIMRCGNTGISGFIARTGASRSEAEARSYTALAGNVHPYDDVTLYVRFGDWLPKLCFTMMIVILASVYARSFGKHSAQKSEVTSKD